MAIVQPANFGDILRNAPRLPDFGSTFGDVATRNFQMTGQIASQVMDAEAALSLERLRGDNLIRANREIARQQARQGLVAQALQSAAARSMAGGRKAGEVFNLTGQGASDPAALADRFNQFVGQINLTRGALIEPWTATTRAGTNAALGLG